MRRICNNEATGPGGRPSDGAGAPEGRRGRAARAAEGGPAGAHTAGASTLYITGVTIRASSVLVTSPPMITHASGE